MYFRETDVSSYWPDVSLSKSRLLALFSESFSEMHILIAFIVNFFLCYNYSKQWT
jgi:hypothetical protein